MPKRRALTGGDTTVIAGAHTEAMNKYTASLGNVRVSGLLQSYNGSKSDLAHALANATGTKYQSQMSNINRWLAYESGSRDKRSTRDPQKNKGTIDRLKEMFIAKNPPSSMSITITGWIGYDNDYRYRTITIAPPLYNINTPAFVNSMRAANTHEAYREVFKPYAAALSVDSADNISIDFEGDEE